MRRNSTTLIIAITTHPRIGNPDFTHNVNRRHVTLIHVQQHMFNHLESQNKIWSVNECYALHTNKNDKNDKNWQKNEKMMKISKK